MEEKEELGIRSLTLITVIEGKVKFCFNDGTTPITVELEGGGTVLDYIAFALALKHKPFKLSRSTCIGKAEDGEAILVSL